MAPDPARQDALVDATCRATKLSWWSTEADVVNSSKREIIDAYDNADSHAIARRVSERFLVKRCVPGTGATEFSNQKHAWEKLDGSDIGNGRKMRIPRPVRCIQDRPPDSLPFDFIVMEFLDGVTVEDSLGEANVSAATKAIHTIFEKTAKSDERRQPGPVSGGQASGFPWGDSYCESAFSCVEDLQRCVDKRLRQRAIAKGQPVSNLPLSGRQFGLCHMDLELRNIIAMSNGDIAIVDWESAGYYPAEFELASLTYWAGFCTGERREVMEGICVSMARTCAHISDCNLLHLVQSQSLAWSVSQRALKGCTLVQFC